MASMAAALALPSLSIAEKLYDPKIDLNPWLCFEDSRYDLSKPWDVEGRSIATDGRRLIRVGLIESAKADGDRIVPQFNNLPWDAFESGGWRKLPNELTGGCDDVSCPECLGIGWIGNTRWGTFSVRDVPEPYRKSWMEYQEEYAMHDDERSMIAWLNRNPTRWNNTGWHGDHMCQRCNGTGWLDEGEVYIVEGVPYDAGYINAAKVFGDIEYRQEDYTPAVGYKYGSDVSKLMLFRGDGFDGMIMPRWGTR
jgi:hypothetical protein